MKDKIFKCQDCGEEFAFTGDEQEFYLAKDLQNPVRCMVCRSIYKTSQKDQFRGEVKGQG